MANSMAAMRVRVAIGLAVLAAATGLVIDMSGSAPRGAGDDHVPRPLFADTVPGGGVLCQGSMVLPDDAASMNVLIGAFGHPVPRIAIDFKNLSGKTVATGVLRAGAAESPLGVTLPLHYPHGPSTAGTLCLHVGGRTTIVFGGDSPFTNGAQVNGRPQAGRVSVRYFRPGSESWWQLLGVLDLRFGLGKSAIFGDWTLPVVALVMLALWTAVVRFLVRELR